MTTGKKETLYYVYKILEEYTDEDHFLTQNEIINKVKMIYMADMERKSVASTIDLLIDLGFDINKRPGGGYALFQRLLEDEEIKYIVDALFSSKSITGKQANSIIEKLNTLKSKYKRTQYKYLLRSDAISRTSNVDVFYNISVIEEAIGKGKKISFEYLTFSKKGEPISRYNGYRYVVSPYYLVNNFGKYYLLANYKEEYRPIQNYRIEYMINIEIVDKPLKPITSLKGCSDFDIVKYLNEHVYLFSDKVVTAKIKITEPYGIQYIFEYFGDKTEISYDEETDTLYTYVKSSAEALFYWIIQYGNCFELEEPEELLERIRKYYEKEIEKYGRPKNGT